MGFMPTGINDFDQIVGTTTAGVSGVLDFRTEQFTAIEVAGARSTDATAINNLGQVAGTYTDSSGNVHAFVDTHGRIDFLQLPASLPGTLEAITSINDLGQVVGHLLESDGATESFIATPKYFSRPENSEGSHIWQGAGSHQTSGAWHVDVNTGGVGVPLNISHS
jgi:probable HAF family extracellular repeat protein